MGEDNLVLRRRSAKIGFSRISALPAATGRSLSKVCATVINRKMEQSDEAPSSRLPGFRTTRQAEVNRFA